MGFVLGESRGRKPCVFPCKVAPAGDEKYLVCAAGAVGVNRAQIGSFSVFCNEWLFMCRDSMRFLTLWLPIAV